jgi:hypothetical protein
VIIYIIVLDIAYKKLTYVKRLKTGKYINKIEWAGVKLGIINIINAWNRKISKGVLA